MSSVEMNPTSNLYLTSFLESNHLSNVGSGLVDLDLSPNTEINTPDTAPQAATTGNLLVYLKGEVKVTTGSADMELLQFPASVRPDKVVQVSCVVAAGGGAKSVQAVTLTLTGLAAIGTPDTDDIFYLDSIVYFRRF